MPNESRWIKYRNDLLEKIDFVQVYLDYGLELTKTTADRGGWIPCKSHAAFGGEDNNPSAAINITNGIYKDFRADKAMGLFDFMVAIGVSETWRDAQKTMAERFEFTIPSVSKYHPEHGVIWQEWKDEIAAKYCQLKPPITVEGLKRSGAMMCTRFDIPSFAWPIYDDNLIIVGYYYVTRNNTEYSTGGKSKAITYKDSDGGLIGTPAVQSLLADQHPTRFAENEAAETKDVLRRVFWCEGVPDMVAAYSVFGKARFVSNAHGASENITQTQVNILKNSPAWVIFIADGDVAGVLGAYKKVTQFSELLQREEDKSKHLRARACCPYPAEKIVPKKGLDLRDWLAAEWAGKPARWTALSDQKLAEFSAKRTDEHLDPVRLGGTEHKHVLYEVSDPEHIEELQNVQNEVEKRLDERMDYKIYQTLENLRMRILMVYEDGSFVFGCSETNHQKLVRSFKQFCYADLLMVGGKRARRGVSSEDELKDKQFITFKDFVEVLSLAVSNIASCDMDVIGEGIWRVEDKDSRGEHKIVAVRKGTFYFPEDGGLTTRQGPDYGRYIADFEDKNLWFDHDLLVGYLREAEEAEWRQDVHKQLIGYLSTWKWDYKDMDLVCAGLVYATWLQTIWQWRPIITLTGESNSGKTWLLEMLTELFLHTTSPIGASTSAGILQSLKNKATPILLDEMDAAKEQQKLFKTFRSCGRGQKSVKGTAGQVAKVYKLAHMPWLSGIFFSTNAQADLNRLVQLHLLTSDKPTIIRPDTLEAYALGHRILASVLTVAESAREMSLELIKAGAACRSRYLESYAVPFGSLGAMAGIDLEGTNTLLNQYMESFVSEEINTQDSKNDQEGALIHILGSTVRLPMDAPIQEPTVAMMINSPREFAMYWPHMEPKGVAVKMPSDRVGGGDYLALDVKTLVRSGGLLANTVWRDNHGLSQVLRRLQGPLAVTGKATHIGGQTAYCLRINLDRLRSWMNHRNLAAPTTLLDTDSEIL